MSVWVKVQRKDDRDPTAPFSESGRVTTMSEECLARLEPIMLSVDHSDCLRKAVKLPHCNGIGSSIEQKNV